MPARKLHTPEPTDAELVLWAREGDRSAFETLYRKHVGRIAGLIYRLLGADDDIDELVQDTFVAAFEGLSDLRDPGSVGSWLAMIAVHHTRQRIAQRQRWRAVLARLVQPRATEPKTGDAKRALAQLPPRLRIPFVLHHLEGFTIRETSNVCETSVATTKRRCAEATKRLSRRLR